jgi:hypothetical protein
MEYITVIGANAQLSLEESSERILSLWLGDEKMYMALVIQEVEFSQDHLLW